jgi:protoheme IX farnesyltransferase
MQNPSNSVRPPIWKCYLKLSKSNVVFEMVFTAIVGMLLASPGLPPIVTMIYASLGIGFAAASSASINQIIEIDVDKDLNPHRPLPMGWLTPAQARNFALALAVISMLILVFLVNTLTAILTLLSGIGYSFFYTKYLKKWTSQNIVVGGIFGATPPLLGWCAITNSIEPHALLLVLIIFVWTPPHYWPLSIARIDKNRYIFETHGIPKLPVTHGIPYTCVQILLYTILLVIAIIFPFITHMSGLIYLSIVLPLSLGYLYLAIRLMQKQDQKTAMFTFWFSLVYITLLFAALVVDHYFKYTL